MEVIILTICCFIVGAYIVLSFEFRQNIFIGIGLGMLVILTLLEAFLVKDLMITMIAISCYCLFNGSLALFIEEGR
jgi:hypothetical protein